MAYKNPADAAMPYLQQVPGTISPYYNPYITAGNQALTTLLGQYSTLLNDPSQIMQMLGSGFQSSPGYQYQYNQAMNAANSAAASGGMLGTPYQQNMAAGMATNLANQDYYNYLNDTMGLYKTGLSGESDINHMGYNASDALASALGTNLNNEAGLAYAGQSNKNQADADFWNTLLGGISTALGGTVGGLAGGPVGAAAGANIGHSIFGSSGSAIPYPSSQNDGSSNGMLGPGGTQQDFMQALKNKIAELFHSGGNGMNSTTMGGYY